MHNLMLRSNVAVVSALATAIVLATVFARLQAQATPPEVTRITLSADRTVVFIDGRNLGGQAGQPMPVITLGDDVLPNVIVNVQSTVISASIPLDLAPGLY